MRTPPLLVSFPNKELLFSALSLETKETDVTEIEGLLERRLPPAVSIRCVATLFGYSPKFVGTMFHRSERYYRTFTIHTGKKKRVICAPRVALKVIQKWLAEHLANAINLSDHAHGFIKERSSVTAAQVHLGARWVYSIDIKDFFQSTPQQKVYQSLRNIGYSHRAATFISKISCFGGFLAQGAPTSPFLSNLVFQNLDERISLLATAMHIKYTRYADDLVFSGVHEFPQALMQVKDLIQEEGWTIATKKEHLSSLPNRLKVHGLLVHGDKVRLTKGYRNRIRVYKHLIETKGQDIENLSVLNGHISYAASIDKASNS